MLMVQLGALLFTRVILESVCLKKLRRTDWLLVALISEEQTLSPLSSLYQRQVCAQSAGWGLGQNRCIFIILLREDFFGFTVFPCFAI